MNTSRPHWRRRTRAGFVVLLLAVIAGLAYGKARADQPATLVSPSAPQIRKILDYPANQPLRSTNTDCTTLTYRLESDSTMQSGCFMATTNGLMQNGGPLIYDGTDEATPLEGKGYSLTPLPNQSLILAVSGAATFGANLSFYHFSDLTDDYPMNGIRLMRYKMPNGPPPLTLLDSQHQPVVVSTNTMAFSSNGDWLVTESPRHALIRVNLATLQITAFAPPFNTQPWDYSLPMHPMAISDDGRFIAVQGGTPLAFKVYDLSTCSGGNSDNLSPMTCAAHDYWPLLNQTVPNISGEYGLEHVRFVNDNTLNFELKYNDVPATGSTAEQWQSASYMLSADGSQSAIDYLAVGDSYTSGEGTFDYTAGTDTDVNRCHLSPHAYPFLVGQHVFNLGHSVACSGATISDINNLSSNYYGQAADQTPRKNRTNTSSLLADFDPGYLAQIEFVKTYQPRVITVSVSGNDVGFADILQQCAEPHLSQNTCYSTYEDKAEVYNTIDRKYRDLVTLYGQLKAAAPASTIYAVGYPQVAVADGGCALNVHLNHDEIVFAQNVISHLDSMIQTAAVTSGLHYADISQALAGHRLCEAKSFDVGMNGLTNGTDAGFLGVKFIGKESFHPNAFGHSLIANTLLAATHDLAAVTPTVPAAQPPPDSSHSPDLLAAPKTGRPLNDLVWDDSMTSGKAQVSQALTISISSDLGLAGSSSYQVSLDHGQTVLGQLLAASDGSLSGKATMPNGVDTGTHSVDVAGTNAAGDPVDVTGTVYVAGNGNDADGDGIPDNKDSCPAVPNAGVDADQDGIDDACDPLIGQSPDTTASSGQPDTTPTNPNSGNTNDPNPDYPANPLPQSAPTSALQANANNLQIAFTPANDAPLPTAQLAAVARAGPANTGLLQVVHKPTNTKVPAEAPPGRYPQLPKFYPQASAGLVKLSLWLLCAGPLGYAFLKNR